MAKFQVVSVTVKATMVEAGMPTQYTVGQAPVEGAAVVEKIVHHKHAYNSGHQGDFPCYAVHLADGLRRLITMDMIGMVDVATPQEAPAATEEPASAAQGDSV